MNTKMKMFAIRICVVLAVLMGSAVCAAEPTPEEIAAFAKDFPKACPPAAVT